MGEAGDLELSSNHVLVGLASVEDTVAARILADHGLAPAAVRAVLADMPP